MASPRWSRGRWAIIQVALVLTALGIVFARAQQSAPRPILVLISFDGWRWDYITRTPSPNLKTLAARGVRSEGLIPVFPSKTFPNHYTIVTGLYPEHHGIIANNISDPDLSERFAISTDAVKDAQWWGGEPIWNTARRQGVRSATMFWPGSDAPIGGFHPTYWRPFDDEIANGGRVDQVLEWLALPEAERPSLVTAYFSEMDHAGHDYGPDSPQVVAAAAHLDSALGQIVTGIERLGLKDRTTIVIVSDHGMASLDPNRVIYLDNYIDLNTIDVVDWSPVLALRPRSISIEQAYAALKGKNRGMRVYRKAEIPKELHYRMNPRITPIVAIAREGWRITSHAREEADRKAKRAVERGDHGYEPTIRSMHALFVAAGPQIREGIVAPKFQNIHLYEFLCAIAGLTPAANDGDSRITRSFFKD